MPDKPPQTSRAIVIFGATGDLALRMLFPSLYFLESETLLPPDLLVVGSARAANSPGTASPRRSRRT